MPFPPHAFARSSRQMLMRLVELRLTNNYFSKSHAKFGAAANWRQPYWAFPPRGEAHLTLAHGSPPSRGNGQHRINLRSKSHLVLLVFNLDPQPSQVKHAVERAIASLRLAPLK